MKSTFSVRCKCGEEIVLVAMGTQLFKGTDCPQCHSRLEIIDNGFVSWRVFNRSWLELQSDDFTLSIILGAMAMECEMARLYIKWKNIDLVEPGAFATKEQEDSCEKELRRATRVVTKLDLVCRFLTGEDFDTFFLKTSDLTKALRARHPESVDTASPKKFFEETLFHRRNRIVHLGKIDYDRSDAESCYRCAATLFQALGEMDVVRRRKLDASLHQSAGSVQFKELGKERTFGMPELQVRADANPLAPGRKQYRVQVDQQDAAYLSFDTFWNDQLNLYEIFVAESFRGQGIGSECIRFAVDLTKELGKRRLTVRPTPLSGQRKDDLIGWYVRRGFVPAKDAPELLEIPLD